MDLLLLKKLVVSGSDLFYRISVSDLGWIMCQMNQLVWKCMSYQIFCEPCPLIGIMFLYMEPHPFISRRIVVCRYA